MEPDIRESITLTYDKVDYELGFDRASVEQAENLYGFDLRELTQGIKVNYIRSMFDAAFLKNHPRLSQSKKNEIYAHTKDKPELYLLLVQMYAAAVNSLLDDSDIDEGKAASWK